MKKTKLEDTFSITQDPYSDTENQARRLIAEWNKYGKLIVAFDYDNTVYDYHNNGWSFTKVKQQLRTLGRMGCEIVCFTSCDSSRFEEIKSYCRTHNLPLSGVNVDSDLVPFKGRKIYYNVFYDDRAGLGQVIEVMDHVIDIMKFKMIDKANEITDSKWNSTKGVYSGQPFLRGDWTWDNQGIPAAYDINREENDIIPSIQTIWRHFN